MSREYIKFKSQDSTHNGTHNHTPNCTPNHSTYIVVLSIVLTRYLDTSRIACIRISQSTILSLNSTICSTRSAIVLPLSTGFLQGLVIDKTGEAEGTSIY